jgi:hypothetical protein
MKRLTADQVIAGFIGLGNMGSRIVQRLRDHGYQVCVYDRNRAKAEALASHGGVVAASVLELARSSDVVLSCLTNDEAVQSVYSGPEGVFAGARPGIVVLEMSTISPISMGFAEALSDDGSLTGRGTPWLRGSVCGAMTALGGVGHTLPFLLHDFNTATTVAFLVVLVELATITWVRHRFMDTPPLSAAMQVALGGALVFATGILIGNS